MTISLVPADDRFRRFVCTGGETAFPVTFPFFAASDLVVARERSGVQTVLAMGPDYAVAGAGNPSGGTVTLTAAALAGDVIAITGQQPIARTSAWTDGQALTATALNAEHARHVIVHQQLARDIGRGLRLPLTEPATELRLPAQSARANRLLGFNAAGEPVPAVPNTGNLVVTPFAQTLLDDADAAAARATLGIPGARWVTLVDAEIANSAVIDVSGFSLADYHLLEINLINVFVTVASPNNVGLQIYRNGSLITSQYSMNNRVTSGASITVSRFNNISFFPVTDGGVSATNLTAKITIAQQSNGDVVYLNGMCFYISNATLYEVFCSTGFVFGGSGWLNGFRIQMPVNLQANIGRLVVMGVKKT